VTLHGPAGEAVSFEAAADRSIARSALAAGYALTTGCLQGRCAICRARLLAGTVRALRRPSPQATVDPAALPDGCVLPCSVRPCSDVVLAPFGPWMALPPR